MTKEVQVKSVVRDIKDFDFEAGWASGYGDYTADINVDGKGFSVDLTYEYGYDDAGESVGCHESNGSDLGNDVAIEIAAQQAGIELDEGDVQGIMHELEDQVENYVEDNYDQTIKSLLIGFENHQEELRQERDEEFGMSM